MAALFAGSAQVEITPELGVHLAGSVGEFRPALDILDPIFARAVVVEAGGKKLCILTLDVTIVCEVYTDYIRKQAKERFGLEPDAVMVHATQTHSAPPLGHFMVDPDFPPLPDELEWLQGGDTKYNDWAAERAIEAIGLAIENLAPTEVGVGSGAEGRMAFNRRAVTRDGGIIMPWWHWDFGDIGPTHIRYIEGPIDPEVGVLCFRREDKSLPAVFVHHTCHPVHVFPKQLVSADWPGAVSAQMAQRWGAQVVPVINGACGNINPWPPFDPDYVEDHNKMGATLVKCASAVLDNLEFSSTAVVDWKVNRLQLPLREVPAEELTWAKEVLARNPVPQMSEDRQRLTDPDWMTAASIYSVELARQRNVLLEYEIQCLRIGDCAIVGLPGEPFVEGQLAIKLASPAGQTYIAHCTSHYVGYVPTREALQRGGHEVNTRYWAKLQPDALEQIVQAAGETLEALWQTA